VITVSKANADYIHRTFDVPETHIHVIPCGVDLVRFRPGRKPEPPAGLPVILCVARFVVVKNLALLLHACALLRDRGARFRCVLIGDGPLRQELEAKRAELGLQTIVEMPGATGQDKVAGWWQRAAAGLLTSQNEGMPVCLMEAAASGVPVVATRVGGIPELVEDSVTGFMCAPGDAAGIASALEKLLTDPELNSRIGTAARKQAEARFSLERQVNSLLNLWSALLDGGGA
jgi:glycosyltransferase involved in cell wall biosynthesis